MKILKSRFEEISIDPNFRIKFIEQGGSKIKNLLVKQNPFPTSDCHDAICPICNKTSVLETGDKSTYRVPCSTESVGYRIVCLTCKQQGKLATYEGETDRPDKWHFLTQKLLICLFCQAQPQLQLQLSWRLSWLYSHVYTTSQPSTHPPRRV